MAHNRNLINSRIVHYERGDNDTQRFFDILADEIDEVARVNELLRTRTGLEPTTRGRWLDLIGKILGQERGLSQAQLATLYALGDVAGSPVIGLGLSGLNDPEAGGQLTSLNPVDAGLQPDDEYYQVLLGRALAISTGPTFTGMVNFARLFTGLDVTGTEQNKQVTLAFMGQQPDGVTRRVLLATIPRLAGIKVEIA